MKFLIELSLCLPSIHTRFTCPSSSEVVAVYYDVNAESGGGVFLAYQISMVEYAE